MTSAESQKHPLLISQRPKNNIYFILFSHFLFTDFANKVCSVTKRLNIKEFELFWFLMKALSFSLCCEHCFRCLCTLNLIKVWEKCEQSALGSMEVIKVKYIAYAYKLSSINNFRVKVSVLT